jgi:hypothetical protein
MRSFRTLVIAIDMIATSVLPLSASERCTNRHDAESGSSPCLGWSNPERWRSVKIRLVLI